MPLDRASLKPLSKDVIIAMLLECLEDKAFLEKQLDFTAKLLRDLLNGRDAGSAKSSPPLIRSKPECLKLYPMSGLGSFSIPKTTSTIHGLDACKDFVRNMVAHHRSNGLAFEPASVVNILTTINAENFEEMTPTGIPQLALDAVRDGVDTCRWRDAVYPEIRRSLHTLVKNLNQPGQKGNRATFTRTNLLDFISAASEGKIDHTHQVSPPAKVVAEESIHNTILEESDSRVEEMIPIPEPERKRISCSS